MTAAVETVPRWAVLPLAVVTVALVGAGLSDATDGAGSVLCLAAGALHGIGTFVALRGSRRRRGRSTFSWMMMSLTQIWFLWLMPVLWAMRWGATRFFLWGFARQHRELMRPGERMLLTVRESGGGGDVWVLSNQALYIGPKTSKQRFARIAREHVVSASDSKMGDLRAVTLTIRHELEDRLLTGCFTEIAYQHPLRRLTAELAS